MKSLLGWEEPSSGGENSLPAMRGASDLLFRWTDLNDKNAHVAASERKTCHIVKIKSQQSQKKSVFTPWTCSFYQLLQNSKGSSWDSTPLSTSSHLLRPQTRKKQTSWKIYLFCKKRWLVSSISRFVSSAPHWFHVWNSHPKNCQLVRLTSQGATSGYHIREFGDVLCHLISPASLNFTMILSEHLEKHQTNRKADMISKNFNWR